MSSLVLLPNSVLKTYPFFNNDFNEVLVQQVLVSYLAKRRLGTSSQKGYSEISGSGKKPWRQKGTGRARVGSVSSCIWRSGAKCFASKKQDFSKKVNKKMYRRSLSCIFSECFRQGRIVLVKDFFLKNHKTDGLVSLISAINYFRLLIISPRIDFNLYLSSRNLYNVSVVSSFNVDPYSLLSSDKILISESALYFLNKEFCLND